MTSRSVDPVSTPDFTWVDTAHGFAEVVERVSQAPRIAIDTETDSLYHYVPKVCLLQISTDDETFVVCPFAIPDLSALQPVTQDPAIEKVFHAAGGDISSLHRDYGLSFTNVFDTHLAAQLTGHDAVGLSALLQELLGIAHSKRRQRDDWSRRPLDPEQLTYAAMDTHHLLEVRDILVGELRTLGRLSWAQEEFEYIAQSREEERQFDPQGFRKIKGCRELRPRQQTVLHALYVLRERLAQEMDVPPFKVMGNLTLITLVRYPPRTSRELSARRGVSARIMRRYATEILETLAEARTSDLVEPPRRRIRGAPPSAEARRRLDRLKRWRVAKAHELALSLGIVFPGAQIEMIARSAPESLDDLVTVPGMRRWRVAEFGSELLGILRTTS